jgi:tetratricopeptide (TPR) repeat protein
MMIMRYFTFILLILAAFPLHAQKEGQPRLDSLLIELKSASKDTNKVSLLEDLSFNYYTINPELGLGYGFEGLSLSRELRWQRGEARCLSSIGSNYFALSQFDSAKYYLNLSKEKNLALKHYQGVASCLNNIALIYHFEGDKKKELETLKEALAGFREHGSKQNIASALNNIGITYKDIGNYGKALEYFFNAAKIFQKIGLKQKVALASYNIGLIYFEQGLYPKALDYFKKSLEMNNEIGDISGQSLCLSSFGDIYKMQGEYDAALDYYQKALKLDKQLGNKQGVSSSLHKIGTIYVVKDSLESASKYFDQSLQINNALENFQGVATCYSALGNVYSAMRLSDKSLDFYKKSYEINIELGDYQAIAGNLFSIASEHILDAEFSDSPAKKHSPRLSKSQLKQKHTTALEYLLESKVIAEELELNDLLIEIYHYLSICYEYLGKTSLSLDYYKKFKSVNDSVHSVVNARKIARLEMQYDYEKEEFEKILATRKHAQEQEQRNRVQYTGILLLVFALFIIIFIMMRYKVSSFAFGGLVFLSFLIFFEFLLVVTESWVDEISQGEPIIKLGINLALAIFFIPLHYLEEKVRMKGKK